MRATCQCTTVVPTSKGLLVLKVGVSPAISEHTDPSAALQHAG